MMSSNQKLRVPPNIKHQFIFIEILSMLAKRAYDESAVFKQIHHCKCSTNTPVILDPFVASPHLIAELLQYQSVTENELDHCIYNGGHLKANLVANLVINDVTILLAIPRNLGTAA